jgi:hypothetical protein
MRRISSRTLLMAAGIIVLGVLGKLTGTANATTMQALSLRELVEHSQKIVRGKITAIEVAQDQSTGSLWTLYTMDRADLAKGTLKRGSSKFSFRCVGGIQTFDPMPDGSPNQVEDWIDGTPRFKVGEEVIIFYSQMNQLCEVLGWEQGAFKSWTQPSGAQGVYDYQGRAVTGLSDKGLMVGKRPSWIPEEPEAGGTHIVGTPAQLPSNSDQGVQPDDFMRELRMLAKAYEQKGPADAAS